MTPNADLLIDAHQAQVLSGEQRGVDLVQEYTTACLNCNGTCLSVAQVRNTAIHLHTWIVKVNREQTEKPWAIATG